MKFLVDAQLPPALCRWLADMGHEAQHVSRLLSGETPDHLVADYALENGMVLLTKDDDFAFRHRLPGLCVVWIRIGNSGNRALGEWLGARWQEIEAAIQAGEALVEVI